jgi:hypothetical protein
VDLLQTYRESRCSRIVSDLEPENAILRHQVGIPRRQVKRPVYRTSDKAFLATASRMLRREAWGTFLVRPATLLRWHRQLVAAKWTRPHCPPGHPSLDAEVRELVLPAPGERAPCRRSSSRRGRGAQLRPRRAAARVGSRRSVRDGARARARRVLGDRRRVRTLARRRRRLVSRHRSRRPSRHLRRRHRCRCGPGLVGGAPVPARRRGARTGRRVRPRGRPETWYTQWGGPPDTRSIANWTTTSTPTSTSAGSFAPTMAARRGRRRSTSTLTSTTSRPQRAWCSLRARAGSD